ncbi:hypothetical protein AAE478_007019 [Parahypoxylon ruwenzoriense]
MCWNYREQQVCRVCGRVITLRITMQLKCSEAKTRGLLVGQCSRGTIEKAPMTSNYPELCAGCQAARRGGSSGGSGQRSYR